VEATAEEVSTCRFTCIHTPPPEVALLENREVGVPPTQRVKVFPLSSEKTRGEEYGRLMMLPALTVGCKMSQNSNEYDC